MIEQSTRSSDSPRQIVPRLSVVAEEFDLRKMITVLRRRALWILGAVVLFVGGLLAKAASETPLYTASAELLLQARETESLDLGADKQVSSNLPARTVATEVRVVESRAVAVLASKKLGFRATIDATGVADADIVRIVAVDANQARAARIANTFAEQYIVYKKSFSIEDRINAANELDDRVVAQQQQLVALETRLARLAANESSTRQSLQRTRNDLIEQMSTWRKQSDALRLEASLRTGGARVINKAEIPTTPTSPQPVRSLVLGILLGLFLGTGLAFAIDLLDDRVRSKEEIDRMQLGLPVLGLIPETTIFKRSDIPELESFSSPTSPASEAYRTLRSAVQFAGIERDLRVLLITSTDAGESKSTTAANLAVTLARSGSTVCLIDADLRNPRLHMFFGVQQKQGLSDVLLGQARPPEAIVSFAEIDGLGMMPVGRKAPNPAELLGSNRMSVLLGALKKRFDIVIVDSPPILPVVDSLELSRQVDGVLLVTLMGRTRRRGLNHAVELLNNVSAPLLGIVMSGVDKAAGYGYGYGYGYGEATPKKFRRKAPATGPASSLTVQSGTGPDSADMEDDVRRLDAALENGSASTVAKWSPAAIDMDDDSRQLDSSNEQASNGIKPAPNSPSTGANSQSETPAPEEAKVQSSSSSSPKSGTGSVSQPGKASKSS